MSNSVNKYVPSADEVAALADASNELCVALNLLKIVPPQMRQFALEHAFQRREDALRLLVKFGY